jgi:hypothetical protein
LISCSWTSFARKHQRWEARLSTNDGEGDVVTDACVDLQVDQVAPGSLEEPENRLIGEGRRVGEVDGYLNVVEDCVDTNARDRVDARARRGCPGNDGESRLAGGNVKALVDEGPDRAAA